MEHYFKTATFVKSTLNKKDRPEGDLKEVIFVGKSNVGKSSLLNALVNQKNLAYTSSKPGHTRLMNYYLIEKSFYFVDFPGYGFSQKKDLDYKFYGEMIESYFESNEHLKLIVFLLDSRHEPTNDDVDFYNFLRQFNYRFQIVMTKCDKLNQSEKSKISKNLKSNLDGVDLSKVNYVSIKDKSSLLNLKELINKVIKED